MNQQKSPPIQRLTESAMCPKQYTFGLWQRRLPLGAEDSMEYAAIYGYINMLMILDFLRLLDS
jgi:hypothetical protein